MIIYIDISGLIPNNFGGGIIPIYPGGILKIG